jgi:SAM-dependent methyltransferase
METQRAFNEIKHGKFLADGDTELIWGWGTPAGRLRARRRADLIITAADLRPGMRVLEIGCGTGNFTELFVKSGCKILAVDISPDLLAKAKDRKIPSDQVQFMEMRFEDAGAMGPFDAVIGSSILHHLDVPVALAKILNSLRGGGRIAFAEPNLLNPQVYLERRLSRSKLFSYVSPDETAFVRSKLYSLLEQRGFTDILITPFDWLHPATPKPLIPLVSKVGTVIERVPLIKEFSGSLAISARKP